MERVFTVAQENFAKKGGPKRLENSLSNLDEFMSDMVSRKDVQKWSNEIEVSGESLWDKFKKLARNILQSLGLVKLKEGSLLEAFLDTYLEVKENKVIGNGDGKLNSPNTNPYTKQQVLDMMFTLGSAASTSAYNSVPGVKSKKSLKDQKRLNESNPDIQYIRRSDSNGKPVMYEVRVEDLGNAAKRQLDSRRSLQNNNARIC